MPCSAGRDKAMVLLLRSDAPLELREKAGEIGKARADRFGGADAVGSNQKLEVGTVDHAGQGDGNGPHFHPLHALRARGQLSQQVLHRGLVCTVALRAKLQVGATMGGYSPEGQPYRQLLQVGNGGAEQCFHQARKSSFRWDRQIGQRVLPCFLVLTVQDPERLEHELFFGVEVVVADAPRQASALGNFGHGHAIESFGGDDLDGGLKELVASQQFLLGAGSGRLRFSHNGFSGAGSTDCTGLNGACRQVENRA